MSEFISAFVFLLIGTAVLTISWYLQWKRKYASLPPSPPTTPFFGNLSQLDLNGRPRLRRFADLVNQYGKNGVGTLYFSHKPMVVITQFETIKKLLNGDHTTEPLTGLFRKITRDTFYQEKGLIFTEGDLWKQHRRFAFSTLRDFGMGKAWLQDLVIEEANDLVQDLKKTNSTPVNPDQFLLPCISNVICAIALGQRFSHDDQKFRRLASLIGQNIRLWTTLQSIELFPFLRFIPFLPLRTRHLQAIKNNQEIAGFLQSLMAEHNASLHDGQPRDYIHAFMLEQEKQKENKNTTFTSLQLNRSISNLFEAGTETTATTLSWAIQYLLENQKVYEKVRAEVDRTIRDGSYPTLEDKVSLPYSQAVIFEVQRMANLVPVAARGTTEEIEINGYKIPAGVSVLPLLSAVHDDPKYFPEPRLFRPERFLDHTGALLTKVEGFVPFSIGKRACIGQSLAQMELFIFFVTLIKYFTFRLPPGETISTENSVLGIVHSPQPYTDF